MAIEIIKGESFESLADNIRIIYRHTHEVLNVLKNPPNNDFILISHNSDGKITKSPKRFNMGSSNDFDYNSVEIPKNLIKWFGQNIDVEDEKIVSIPIGLENSMWFPEVKKQEKILNKSYEEKNYKNLLYVCHNIRTNPPERLEPYDIFKNKSWVTMEYGTNGNNFDNYLDKLFTHKFVLCPEGNGTDTHRTWETLYVKSIPIEKRNLNNRFYTDLPICFVDNWSDINEEFLNKEYERITNTKWNLEKLDFNYWRKTINSIII